MSGPHKRSIISIVFSLCFNRFSAIYRCKYFSGSFEALLIRELIRLPKRQMKNNIFLPYTACAGLDTNSNTHCLGNRAG